MQEKIEGIIVKSLGGFYYVDCHVDGKRRIVECRARGLFRQQNIKPCVGDMALIELTDNQKGYVQEISARKNSLVRPPLANLDQLMLITSIAQPRPNLFVLDKMIALSEYQHIEPVVIVTKSDLSATEHFEKIYREAGFLVLVVCSMTGEGIDDVKKALSGKISAFCGNSGTGKSTLLNTIDVRLNLDTAQISQKLGRGKHTTRHVELFELQDGGYVADTPGFSAVDLEKFQRILKDQLSYCFREFLPYINKCKYTGCSHTKEAGCEVLKAVQAGIISQSRHQSYVSLYEQAKEVKEWENQKKHSEK